MITGRAPVPLFVKPVDHGSGEPWGPAVLEEVGLAGSTSRRREVHAPLGKLTSRPKALGVSVWGNS